LEQAPHGARPSAGRSLLEVFEENLPRDAIDAKMMDHKQEPAFRLLTKRKMGNSHQRPGSDVQTPLYLREFVSQDGFTVFVCDIGAGDEGDGNTLFRFGVVLTPAFRVSVRTGVAGIVVDQ